MTPFAPSRSIARLLFSGLFYLHPNITIITHHLGGIFPYLE